MTTLEDNARMWDALARVVGYNELACDAKDVASKMYLRLARDHAEADYVAWGGAVLSKSASEKEIVVPTNPPFLVLGPQDVELMRKAVEASDNEEIARLKELLDRAYGEICKQAFASRVVFDREIVEKAQEVQRERQREYERRLDLLKRARARLERIKKSKGM